jgi:hypothetical protein
VTAAARLPEEGPAAPETVAQALLDGVLSYFADPANVGPGYPPLPARRYVAGGDPRTVAWDDTAGQVTVCLGRILLGLDAQAAPRPQRVPRADPANAAAIMRTASYEVQIVRAAPALAPAEELHTHGLLLTRDAGHLIRAVLSVTGSGALSRRPVGEQRVTVDDLITLGPMGGAAGVAVGVTVPLL